jgi:hypothetical protein
VAGREVVPPPTLKLHGLVHGKPSSGGVTRVAGTNGGHLVVARSRGRCLQNPLELHLLLQITLGQLFNNPVETPLIRSLVWELLRVHVEGLYENCGATELELMVLADFYSKDLGRFFTRNGADLLRIIGAFFKFPCPTDTLN